MKRDFCDKTKPKFRLPCGQVRLNYLRYKLLFTYFDKCMLFLEKF